MKSISVLVAVASFAVLAAGCSKKDVPVTSETNTTSAPIVQDQPVVLPQVTTGTDTTDTTAMPTTTSSKSTIQKDRDAGIARDFPTGVSDLMDRDSSSIHKGANDPVAPGSVQAKSNHSTPLGDSKSGEYTGGKGTYGGKATWGTGPHKDTKMDQPSK